MKLYPCAEWDKKPNNDGNWVESLKNTAASAAKNAVKSLANNVTGGLIGSIMNSKVSIETKHSEFKNAGTHTFLEYLAAANLLVGSEDWIGETAGQTKCPLEL